MIRSSARSKSIRTGGALLIAAVTLALAPGCSESPPTGPQVSETIKIRDTVFLPSTATIRVGQWVAWENVVRDDRTVTSGTGPDDPDAGDLFDVALEGYPPGKPVGGRFLRQFTEPDTITYFTRKYPTELSVPFTGTLYVVP